LLHDIAGMLKKIKSKMRKRAVKKMVRNHAIEILGGIAVAVLTDILTDLARDKVVKKIGKKLR
jgi:Mg/Co/Ni transporter MgtE